MQPNQKKTINTTTLLFFAGWKFIKSLLLRPVNLILIIMYPSPETPKNAACPLLLRKETRSTQDQKYFPPLVVYNSIILQKQNKGKYERCDDVHTTTYIQI